MSVGRRTFALQGGEYVRQWLQEQGILECFDHIAKHKPYGDVYVDDKGVRFLDHMDAYELYTYILLHVPPQKRVASVVHTPTSKENGNETRNENETGKRKPKK